MDMRGGVWLIMIATDHALLRLGRVRGGEDVPRPLPFALLLPWLQIGCVQRTRCEPGQQRFLAHLQLAGSAEAGALLNLGLQRGVDLVVGVANDGRAPGAHVVNVLVAIDIPAVGVLDALEHNGLATHAAEGAHGRVDAAGQQGLGLLEDLQAVMHGR